MATLVIHTGGTIGMIQTDQGFAPSLGVVEDQVQRLAAQSGAPAADIRVLHPLIDSANAAPADWDRIAQTVAEAHDQYDGFVVTHGTDTLAYTAAALCFALEGLDKPVIVTGAMLPLTVEGTDGIRNLSDALSAATRAPAGVWVQFAGRLLHGARVRKSHSSAFNAFAATHSDIPPRQPGSALRRHQASPAQVGILAVSPGMPDALFTHAAETLDGLVLRCYGSGTAPDTPGLRRALQIAHQRAIPVIAVSQCPEGGMALGTYAAGSILRDNGVIDGRDMTVEAAYAKLTYALGRGTTPDHRRALLHGNLCGEHTP